MMRPDSPAVIREQSRAPRHNSKSNLTSLRQHTRFPEVPIAIREHKLSATTPEKSRYFPSMRDQTLILCRASRGIPGSLSKLKSLTPFMQLMRFHEISIKTERNPDFPAANEMSPMFPTSSRDEGQFPCFESRGIPTFHSHLKGRSVSPTETRVEPLSSCNKLKGHQEHPHVEIRSYSPAQTQVEH